MTRRPVYLLLTALLGLSLLPMQTTPAVLRPAAAAAAVTGANFVPASFPPKSGETTALVVGDVTGDGSLDVIANVISEYSLDTLLYVNNGTANPFAGARGSAISGADAAYAVRELADVDGDGRLDLITSDGVLLNNGTSSPFAGAAMLPIGANPQSIEAVAGDVNGDGRLDLVSAEYVDGFRISLYLNDGTASPFANVKRIPVATYDSYSGPLTLGDIDGDSRLDLIVNRDQVILVYRNDGTANPFTNHTVIPAPGPQLVETLALADMNRDGRLDLVAGNYNVPATLYLNNKTATPFANVPARPIGKEAHGAPLTLGDVDNDGDVDVVASDFRSRYLYLNNGSADPFADVVGSTLRNDGEPNAMVLADMDGDGDLDLLTGNQGSDRLYLNTGTRDSFASTPGRIIGAKGSISDGMALGDVDGDGDLDLIVGEDEITPGCACSSGGKPKLYLNTGTSNPFTTAAEIEIGADNDIIADLALGDVDNDGDLDLIVAGRSSTQLYLNRTVAPRPAAHRLYLPALGRGDPGSSAPVINPFGTARGQVIGDSIETRAVVLGDINGDGRLDLVSVGENDNRLYLNNGTAKPFTSSTIIGSGDTNFYGVRVLLGDVNGDGRLDIIFKSAESRLYLNDGTAAPFTANTTSPLGDGAPAVVAHALGDVNGDGRLDLIATSDRQATLFLNNGTAQPFAGVTGSAIGADVESGNVFALGDIDGDGDSDLVVGAYSTPLKLIHNNGTANPFANVASSQISPRDFDAILKIGDVNGDGYVDIIAGSPFRRRELYLNPGPMRYMINNPPYAAVQRPGLALAGGTADGDLLSAGRIFSNTQVISIPFKLFDREGGRASVRAEYSLDGGGRWLPALPAGNATLSDLPTSRQGTPYLFPWDTLASGVFGQWDNVIVRLITSPSLKPHRNGVPGPYQYVSTAATTFPFRLRTTVARVVDANDRPVPGALVYRLPKEAVREGRPLTNTQTGVALASNQFGYVLSRDPIHPGDRLVALQPITRTESFSLAFTSARPINAGVGLDALTVTRSNVQTLAVSPANPLLLFNLSVSLEWDARSDPAFLGRLREDIARASDLLYDWTDGQAALGDVAIHQDREHWNDAHIRIYATNRMRPNAVKGGITEPGVLRPDPDRPQISYSAGQLRMGAIWNRYGEATANLGDDWARTLAHELGHFALFLDDNYLGLDSQGGLGSIAGCRGAMSDPYRDDWGDLHPPGPEWDRDCAETLSERLTGRSDWETIARMYDRTVQLDGRSLPFALKPPAQFNANPGPAYLPLDLSQIDVVAPAGPATLASPVVVLSGGNGSQLQPPPGAGARGFLFQKRPADEGGDRVIDLGAPTVDQLLARGARPGDEVCLFELDQQRLGCASLSTSYQPLQLDTRTDWRPDISVAPLSSTRMELRVEGLEPGLRLWARLYPGGSAAREQVRLAERGQIYSATLTSDEALPAFDGYIYLWVEEAQLPRRAAVIDFRLGGNPGLIWARNAPRGNPGLIWARNAPVLSADGQAILFTDETTIPEGQFYTVQASTSSPTPPNWATAVGPAYRIGTSARLQLAGASLNIGYLGDNVPRGYEAGIAMYRYDPALGRWEKLPTDLDATRNEATAAVDGPGLYQLMTSAALPLPNAGWNLVYFYPGADQPLPAALESIAGNYRAVYGYDAADEADSWKLYAPGLPDWVNDLRLLTYGGSYWVDVVAPTTGEVLPRSGAALGQAGILTPPPATYYAALPTGFPANQDVTATIGGVTCGASRTFTVDNQSVLVVDVVSEGSRAGCGLPGRPVTIKVGAQTFSATWASGPTALAP